MTYLVHIKDGSICFRSPYQQEKFFKEGEGKHAELEILTEQRTLSQNSYYWVFLKKIEEETGNDSRFLHAYFKANLLPKKLGRIVGKSGKTYEVEDVVSTTELNKTEFADYLDKICAMTGVALPDPVEAGYIPN